MPGSETVDALAAAIARTQAEVARPVVLIDGGSGAGKSTLGTAVALELDATLVQLDRIYPGWDGLEDGSRAVVDHVLGDGRWRGWDWDRGEASGWVELGAPRALVIEGSGSLSRAARERASYAVWLELDAGERRRRALARDGDSYAPHWERWAAQEAAFRARERPDLLADLVVEMARIRR